MATTAYDDISEYHDDSGNFKEGHKGFGPSKYTKEFVTGELNSMLSEIENNDYIYLGQLFLKRNYSSKKFPMWKIWFKDDEEVMSLHDMVSSRLETRKVVGGLKKELDGRMVRAVLAMQYPDVWVQKEKKEITHVFDKEVLSEEKERILKELTDGTD